MDDSFKAYEHHYLQRVGTVTAEESEERRKIEEMRSEASSAALDSWDYAVLELTKRDDMAAPLKIGTMRYAKSMLKLYCQGMLTIQEREPEFDEKERLQAFFDSPAYKQYEERLRKIMDKNTSDWISRAIKITDGIPKLSFMERLTGSSPMKYLVWYDLTEKGESLLREKRAEALEMHKRLEVQYRKDAREFYAAMQDRSPDTMMLPMMLVMGFTSGAMMGHLMSVHAGPEYASLAGGVQHLDSLGGLGDYASDFDGGDAGFDVGF